MMAIFFSSKNLKKQLATHGLYAALAAIVLALAFLSPAFFTTDNFINIGRQVATLGIIASAMTFIIIAGEIDLSVGAVAGASGVMAALALSAGFGVWAIPVALAVGLCFGLLSGLLVNYTAVPSFIATLVSYFIAQGLARTMTGGGRTIIYDAPMIRDVFATGTVLGINSSLLWLALILFAMWWLLSRTKFGAHIYAMGGNQASAVMVGLNVKRLRLAVFAMAGVLSGLVGIITISRIGNARADAAIGLEFDAIAAVVIGGTALGGGYGSIIRTMVGVLLIGVLNNGLAILNVDFNTQQIVKGLLVVGVVLFDRWARSVEEKP